MLISLGACVGQARAVQADATVAPNGDGQFKSIQDAINAAPQTTSRTRRWVIHIKPGVYKELIYVQREKRFISLVGDDAEKTILTYNLNANMLGQDGKITGPGAQKEARVSWSRQLPAGGASRITAEKVLRGVDSWNPKIPKPRNKTSAVAANVGQTTVDKKAHAFRNCVSKIGIRKDLEYSRAGGESLRLDACVPDGKGPFPAVILVHGGGWSSGDKTKSVDALLAPFSKSGLGWFSINYRHAPKYRYPAAVEDVEAAVRWVKEHATEFNVDPKRLALLGESAGGHLVAMAVVRAKDDTRVAAAVPFYAPVDLESDTQRRGGLSLSLRDLFGRSYEVDDQAALLLREASPINYVHSGLPPFLLVHGTADMSVPYNQSVQLQARLRATGVSCDLITIDDGVHGMARWEATDPTYKDKVANWIAGKLGIATSRRAGLR